MSYYVTSTYALEGGPTPENCIWGFSVDPSRSRPGNRLQSPQPRWKNRATITKTASGIPLWPSRDPIGENFETGEYNVYSFVSNRSVNEVDILGEALCGGVCITVAVVVGRVVIKKVIKTSAKKAAQKAARKRAEQELRKRAKKYLNV
ncbi:hypothetical protein [Roseibacillus ishigakijimensis]|uniref:Uncharacterized protein n=1 Tax=Roseibacillus ishigakijimensis TaxID=454146 RepID=A0A934RQJ0_9BACT|nr:hypothetical protein [Roseibacillus ishigakijimensis]MBK1832425.1 hypothetical protein [Roseibacillus ishigakijimensis]